MDGALAGDEDHDQIPACSPVTTAERPRARRVGLGIGGNLLVGGMDGSISLQPLSIEGNTGLNVAAGVAMMDLKFESVAGINK